VKLHTGLRAHPTYSVNFLTREGSDACLSFDGGNGRCVHSRTELPNSASSDILEDKTVKGPHQTRNLDLFDRDEFTAFASNCPSELTS